MEKQKLTSEEMSKMVEECANFYCEDSFNNNAHLREALWDWWLARTGDNFKDFDKFMKKVGKALRNNEKEQF